MFFNPTVESITASLFEQVEKLKALSVSKQEAASENERLAAEHAAKAASARKEAQRATTVATKIGALLSDVE